MASDTHRTLRCHIAANGRYTKKNECRLRCCCSMTVLQRFSLVEALGTEWQWRGAGGAGRFAGGTAVSSDTTGADRARGWEQPG